MKNILLSLPAFGVCGGYTAAGVAEISEGNLALAGYRIAVSTIAFICLVIATRRSI